MPVKGSGFGMPTPRYAYDPYAAQDQAYQSSIQNAYTREAMSAAFRSQPVKNDPVQHAQDARRHDDGTTVALQDGRVIPHEFLNTASEASRRKGRPSVKRAIENHAKTLYVLSQMTAQHSDMLEQQKRHYQFVKAGFWKRIWYALIW